MGGIWHAWRTQCGGLKIVWMAKKRKKHFLLQPFLLSDLETIKRKQQEKQITLMLLTVTSLFCITTTPVAVAIVISEFSPTLIPLLAWQFLILIQFINHSLNVLMYISVSAQFRNQFMMVMCGCCRKGRDRLKDYSKSGSSIGIVSSIAESVQSNVM